MPKLRKTNKVNYRQEDEIVNNPQSCTSLECSMYRTPKDDEIDIMRQKRDTGIQALFLKKVISYKIVTLFLFSNVWSSIFITIYNI